MAYSEMRNTYLGQDVVEYNTVDDWQGPHYAYRLREEYDDKVTIADRLTWLLERPGVELLRTLVIGAWNGACEGSNSEEISALLAKVATQLPGLRAIFFGEITYEECEISWINQSDMTPLLSAYPRLESLRIRGGNGLSFTKTRHTGLKELAIETGGLSRQTLREMFLCDFPSLEHLELLLGEENYGFDGGVEDLQPVLSGKLYPQLKYLGLMNSTIANDIAAVVVNSPVASRIETLDLSLGNIDDEGFQSLHALTGHSRLKQLNVSFHYASPEAVIALQKTLKCAVDASDPQSPDDEWRPIVHAE